MIGKITRRLGARGFLMLVCAYIWFWLGLANYHALPQVRTGVVYLTLDPDLRAGMWWVTAVVAVVGASLRGRVQIVALGLLVFVPAFVIGSYGISYVYARYPGGHEGYIDGWYQSGIYLALPALVLAAALIPAPPTRIVAVVEAPL